MPAYVQAAVICEKVLVEQDRVLSAIRIIDKLTALVEPSRETPVLAVLALLVGIKFGEGPRPNRLLVDVVSPDGERRRVAESPAGIAGEEGANIHVRSTWLSHCAVSTGSQFSRMRPN